MCEYSIPDEQLRVAARQVRDAMLSSLPEPSECPPDFSASFTQSIEALIQQSKRKSHTKRIFRFTAAVLALIVIGSSIWLAADTRAYAEFQKWVRNVYENTVINQFFSNTDRTSLPEYTFGWLPDGYEVTESKTLKTSAYVTAQNSHRDTVYLNYQVIDENTQVVAYGEGLIVEEAVINGIQADSYSDKADEPSNTLFWIEDNIAFYLTSQLEKDIMIQIAENLKK